ncbi:prepilin-type N-terminal cleavage/methylation domain-containing protein [Acidiferrobacter sp.]|uniref:type IV pilus modification PilV family protein n=1 Tax=Acidiferrobacter sp. TaxID=1872107 RepID=UPI0026092BAD|nr:prepilin-type N-terminal cleavage/methylation domain-containing protein [Acidiferrobacter sp.]
MCKPVRVGTPRGAYHGAAGFTLIENMVALVIFAIGMLAIVFVMLDGMSLSQSSQGLTQAYVAMQEIVGMMRADNLDIYQYNNVNTQTAAPSTATVVGQNITTWMESLRHLPGSGTSVGGYGQIAITPTSGTLPGLCPCNATVTITWAGGRNSYVVNTVVGY